MIHDEDAVGRWRFCLHLSDVWGVWICVEGTQHTLDGSTPGRARWLSCRHTSSSSTRLAWNGTERSAAGTCTLTTLPVRRTRHLTFDHRLSMHREFTVYFSQFPFTVYLDSFVEICHWKKFKNCSTFESTLWSKIMCLCFWETVYWWLPEPVMYMYWVWLNVCGCLNIL